MISEQNVKRILRHDLIFDEEKIKKLEIFTKKLLIFNRTRNLISKSTEKQVWDRHILDSAQLIKFIDVNDCSGIADLGSGGGFPGIILAIFFNNYNFHVKLYEKSPIKSRFLLDVSKTLNLKCKIISGDVHTTKIVSNYIVCRAFKKLSHILNISRENCIKKHKIIILKGKNAQDEVKKTSQLINFEYKLEKSISEDDSWIVILNAK